MIQRFKRKILKWLRFFEKKENVAKNEAGFSEKSISELYSKKEMCDFVTEFFKEYNISKISLDIVEQKVVFLIKTSTPGFLIGPGGKNINSVNSFFLEKFTAVQGIKCKVENIDPIAQKKHEMENRKKYNPEPSKIESGVPTPRVNATNVLRGLDKGKDLSHFSKNDSNITIYIDEGWPGLLPNKQDRINEGIIGGIVWIGDEIDENLLPKITTHLRSEKNPEVLAEALIKLLNCEKAMPFIMPIDNKKLKTSAENSYFELFEASIKIILGWLLPQIGSICNVRIFAEHIGEYIDNADETSYFKGIIKQAKEQNKGRFSRFNIEKVEWKEKNFEYIPYADLVCYFPQESGKLCNTVGRAANYKEFYGYVPLSLSLFPLLSRLNIIEETKNIDDIFKLIDSLYGTKIYSLIMKDLLSRFIKNVEIQVLILKSLEEKYRQKERDLQKLRRYFNALYPFIESLEESASNSIKLLITLLKLQKANHDGDPAKAGISEAKYIEMRNVAISKGGMDLELAVECDLNLGVHYNDRFEFKKALEIHENNYNSGYFNFLSTIQRGKIYSSLGQSYSILSEYETADTFFEEAINIFNDCEHDDKLKDIEQTTVYRLFNALEAKDESYPQMFKEFFKINDGTVQSFAKSDSVLDQYKNHLFVRSIFENDELSELKEQYLKFEKCWQIKPFHPWQLVSFYRALMVHEQNPEKAYDLILEAIEICKDVHHGETVALIGAVIGVVGTKLFDDETERIVRETRHLVERAKKIDGVNEIIEMLEDVLEKSEEYEDIWEILELLRFNYR
ncbi:MAG: KH domain-containing protein [bacterium]